jgi:hypothetical protein
MHPSMPNATVIQAAIGDLKPFFEPGNLLTRNLYVDLPLPWTLTPPVADFDEAAFFRKEWGLDNNEEFFAGGGLTADLDTMERSWTPSVPFSGGARPTRTPLGPSATS